MDGTFVNKFILPGKGRRYSSTRSKGLVWLQNSAGDYFPNHFLKRKTSTVILYSHGNAGTLWDFKAVVGFYSKWFGTSVFAIEYPGYGPAEGEASEDSVNDNFNTAYDFLTKVLKYPPENIIFIGYSIGTGPAINLASELSRQKINLGAVISIAGFMSLCDIVRSWKGSVFVSLLADFLNNRWDNMDKVSQLTCPIFFIHGAKDAIIPVEHSQRMYSACTSSTKKLKVCPEADHTNYDEPNDTATPISEFLEEFMKPRDDVRIKSVPQEYFDCPDSIVIKERQQAIARSEDMMTTITTNKGCSTPVNCVTTTFGDMFFGFLSIFGYDNSNEGTETDVNTRANAGGNGSSKYRTFGSDVTGSTTANQGAIFKTKKHVQLPDDNMGSPSLSKESQGDKNLRDAMLVLDRYFSAFTEHNLEEVLSCLDPNVLVRYPEETGVASKSWTGLVKARQRYGNMLTKSPELKARFTVLEQQVENTFATVLAQVNFECPVSELNVSRKIMYIVATDFNQIIVIDHK